MSHVWAQSEVVTYYYTDPQGSVLATSDAQGAIQASDYHPYGAAAMGVRSAGPGYTGHVDDIDTGLTYMQARYFDSSIGRFLSIDPAPPKPADVFTFGRYVYANANPMRFTDPDGRQVFGSAEQANGKYVTPDESAWMIVTAVCWCDLDSRSPPGSGAVESVATPFEFWAGEGAVALGRGGVGALSGIFSRAAPEVTALRLVKGATRNSPGQIFAKLTSEKAQGNLVANGFAKAVNKDGVVTLTKDGVKYTFYGSAKSTGGPSASVTDSSGRIIAKLRFDSTPPPPPPPPSNP